MSNNNNNAANDISHSRSGQRIDGESQRPSTGAKPAASRGNVASNLESILRMLKEAGEMVPNIPYIKGITGIMLEILKVKDEVVMFKEKWQDVMTDIEQIRSIIEHFGSSSDANDGHQRDNALFITMHNTLRSFEIVLKNVTENLIRCCATHDSSNLATKTLQRHELYATVETCAQAVKQAWRLFDMKLNLISAEINFANNHILQQLNSKNIIGGETTQPPSTTNTSEHHSLATLIPTTPANRVRHPDIFDGSQAKADAFMTACKIFFEADPFYINNDREKILFVLSQMQRREASTWAQRYISTADFSGSLSWNKF